MKSLLTSFLLSCVVVISCSCTSVPTHSEMGEIMPTPIGLLLWCAANPSECPSTTPNIPSTLAPCEAGIDGTPEKCIPQ